MKLLDLAWVFSHYLDIRTPMWVGFNAKILLDHCPKQRISYLSPINQPPTDKAIVLESMRRGIAIANECRDEYAQVAYDLGIAKIAMPLQSTEKPEFKKLFIHLGGMHIEMALFRDIGHFINGSGLTTVMVEAELIGGGSVGTFQSGKRFNRCKRLHILLALALMKLQFQYFVELNEIIVDEECVIYMQEFQNKPLQNYNIENEKVVELLEKFEKFQAELLLGFMEKRNNFIVYTYS